MSTLDSTSTLDEVKAAYADNASYAEDDSLTKAKAFVTACRILLLRLPARSRHGEEEVYLSPQLIQDQLAKAEQWIAGKGSATAETGFIEMSIENYR